MVKQGGVQGRGKVISSSPNCLPHSCLFPCLSLFSTPDSNSSFPKPHFHSQESFSLGQAVFLPLEVGKGKHSCRKNGLQCSNGLPRPLRPRASRMRSRTDAGYRCEGAQHRESSCSPLYFFCSWPSHVLNCTIFNYKGCTVFNYKQATRMSHD